MLYLKYFSLPNRDMEENDLMHDRRTYINGVYPYNIFPNKKLEEIDFSSITIFYGGNGSGKSTILNIISDTIGVFKNSSYAKGERFNSYLKLCKYEMTNHIPLEKKAISSEDIFDYLLNIKRINCGLYNRRSEIINEYVSNKYCPAKSIKSYQKMVEAVDARKMSMSKYIQSRLVAKDIQEQSNGESALMYFSSCITSDGLFILDEPENSMSASMQIKLARFIEDSARFFNSQFIIATHSPFLLSIKDALIYDLDSTPTVIKNWTDLENMQIYYEFFKNNKIKFEKNI